MTAEATEIKILTAKALATVLDKIGHEFERQSGHRLNVVSGFGPGFLRRIDAGEPYDIIAVRLSILDRLFKEGKLIAKTRTELVRSGTGVEVRTGSLPWTTGTSPRHRVAPFYAAIWPHFAPPLTSSLPGSHFRKSSRPT